jgi:hypothetical protein
LNRHEIHVATLHERASATPEGVSRASRTRALGARESISLTPADSALHATQLWFARAITTPEGNGLEAFESEAAVRLTAGPKLHALDRLEIYRRAYHARLVECLVDDYPVLRHALGEEAFTALCRAYIARHPSQSPSLNFYGRHVPRFIREEMPEPTYARGFAADLAGLEWSIVEVIHAAGADPLTLEGLGQVPPSAWASACLAPNNALRLQRFEYPVNAYFQTVRDGGAVTIPSPLSSATVVYRSGATVWRMDLTEPMFAVLSALIEGEALGDALGRGATGLAGLDPGEVTQRVSSWFREWIASGLFVRVVVA